MEALSTLAGTGHRRPLKLLYFVVSLSVSFGFIAAVIAIAYASWFRLPPGVADREYVTALRETTAGIRSLSRRDFEDIRTRAPRVSWFYVQGFAFGSVEAVLPSGSTQAVRAHLVSDGYFQALGVQPAFGSLRPLDGGPAVVLADRVWARLYGRQDVLGASVQTGDGTSMPIIGVAAQAFVGVPQHAPDAWVIDAPPELTLPPPLAGMDRGGRLAMAMPNGTVFGVVPVGNDRTTVLSDVSARLAEYRFDSSLIPVKLPGSGRSHGQGQTPRVQQFGFGYSDSDLVVVGPGLETSPDKRREVVRRTTWLAGIVAMLLLMAFVSTLEFLMAENIDREDEKNVRIAVGAAPMDLFRQTLAENLIIVIAMALLAWLTAGYIVDVVMGVEPFSSYLHGLPVVAKATGLAIAGVSMTLAFLVCIGYMSWFVARSSTALSRSGRWLRATTRRVLLIVGTASLVVVLSLAGRYLSEAGLSLGFENPDAAYVKVSKPDFDITRDLGGGLPSPAPLVDAIEAIPGVRSAASGALEPLAPVGELHHFARDVVGRPELADTPFFENSVTPGFFRTLGVEILAGREFEGLNYSEVVVSRSAAEALGGVDAVLGAPLRLEGRMGDGSESTIVGVVGEIPYGGSVAETAMIYRSIRTLSTHQEWLIDADPGLDVVEALGALPQFAGWEVELGDSPAVTFRKQFLARRSVEIVLSIAAVFALVLALAGIGNSLARTVAEARAQIGIRFALGAVPGELTRAYLGASVLDLALAALVVGGAGLAAKATAPLFTEALDLWLLLPALAGLIAACGLMIHVLIGQLSRRQSVNELVHGSVAQPHAPGGT